MRVPRVRLTIRRALVTVAVVGLVLAGSLWYVERQRRLARAAHYSTLVRQYAAVIAKARSDLPNQAPEWRGLAEYGIEKASLYHDYLVRQQARYERAARTPWLVIEPGPSQPWHVVDSPTTPPL